ncbi:hypothetical protein CR513_12402, partial [Mucuna pruriens]
MEEYHKEMEMGLIRAQIRESEEATVACFLHGLNREIQDVVELQHYSTLGELVHQAIKWFERKREREKEKARREKSPKKGSESSLGQKEATSTPIPMAPWTSNFKCFKCLGKGHIAFQCPNRQAMILKEDGEVENLSDDSHYEGDLLVVKRLMNSHVGEEAKTQRENIFHSRCLILASKRLVKKLTLPTIVHPRSYKLLWLTKKVEFLVDKQVEVMFTLGGYKDKVVCDVVPMEAIHLLLGRPWQFDDDS